MQIRRLVASVRLTRSGQTLLKFADGIASRIDCGYVRLPGADVETLKRFDYAPGDVLVAPRPIRRDVTTFVPFDERSLWSRGLKPCALIPLSNDESGLYATIHAMPILAKLGFEALFWHTTWRDGGNASSLASDHMGADARLVITNAEALALAAGVRYRTVIATADSVPYGIALAALNEECALIVMARGLEAVRGSYVDSVLEASAVPMLVIGRSEGGAS